MGRIYTSLFVLNIICIICVYGVDVERYIPTQEHFVAQQSQSLLHHKIQNVSPFGWFNPGNGGTGSAAAASSSAFSFGPPISSGFNSQQQQFFGGLGFGFGGSWGWNPNPYPLTPNIGIGQGKPSEFPIAPILLKPSDTGWDTSYNVPCGSYKIRPFVRANLRIGTSSSPLYGNGKRKRRSSENGEQSERSLFPYFPSREPKSCSWNFNSDGPCKLKFKCYWFQLPALFSCNENYMQVSDSTQNLNSTFCGNRKPRKVYNSSSGKLILTFRSQTSSLPAVFDCAVTCSLEASSNDQQSAQSAVEPGGNNNKPSRLVVVASVPPINQNVANNESNSSSIVSEKPQLMRFGDCKCGVQDSHYTSRGRIVGGSSASPGEFPWVAALVMKPTASNSQRPFCGANLINDRYVITAAHCVLNNKIIREPRTIPGSGLRNPKELFDVLLNEHDISQSHEIPGGTIRVAVDKIIVHPLYNNVSFHYDVALVRLERPIDLSHSVSNNYQFNAFDFHSERRRFVPEVEARPIVPRPTPICLPNNQNASLENSFGIITGWGLKTEGGIPSNELLKATVQIFNDTYCKKLYKKYNYPVTESMMCAGFTNGKIDACVGDSGGGLVIEENDQYFLSGVISWGRGCGRDQQPGVYSRVGGLIEWVRSEADGVWCV